MNTRIPLAAALFAIAPASLQAVTYSDYVLSLNPTLYYRLDQAVTTPGTVLPNVGTLVTGNGTYSTFGGGVTTTTGSSGGAITGNAGITTTGFAANLTDGLYATHPDRFAAGNNAFSLSLWVKPTSFAVSNWATFFSGSSSSTHDDP
jgi:hypothetical protein